MPSSKRSTYHKKRASPQIIVDNQKTWDLVFNMFVNASALPAWGPFGIGEDLRLLPEIKGKTFLEIGCGSGRSIRYLVRGGAKKVYGLDISAQQVREASGHNKKSIEQGKVELIQGKMEGKIHIPRVDVIVSIYALGWTPEPKTTLQNVYSYLKPGGLFIWSWDHTFFSDVEYSSGKYFVAHSYHEENVVTTKNWRKRKGATAHIIYRKTSTWFKLLRDAGFDVVGYYEPRPRNLRNGKTDPTQYYAIQKARLVPSSFIFVCRKPLAGHQRTS